MNLPAIITRLVTAQNNFDSQAYAECFTGQAIVHDEGKTHQGKAEIQQWIERANQEYQSTMKPLNYESDGTNATISAEVAGTFPGSPAVLQFHFTLENELISVLKVTG